MKRSSLAFFFVLVVIVGLIARYNSRSRSLAERQRASAPVSQLVPSPPPSLPSPAPSQVASPAQTKNAPAVDFQKIAGRIEPAVALISVFEPSGKLLRTGTGFFVSREGTLVTTRSLMEGAAHAVAKTSDGKIDNIDGIVADSESLDLAVLKAEAKGRVLFLVPGKETGQEESRRVAVIGSSLTKTKPVIFEGTTSKSKADGTEQAVEFPTAIPNDVVGAPVTNERGDTIGVLTRTRETSAVVMRPAAVMNSLLAQIETDVKARWLAKTENPPTLPGEGPGQKVPLADESHPGKTKLIYTPAPQYPNSARNAAGLTRGSGRFRLTFTPGGVVKSIVVLRSTQNGALDQAAVEALRRWKSAPSEEGWSVNVPITFQP